MIAGIAALGAHTFQYSGEFRDHTASSGSRPAG
jgi:hypothetical protein